MGPICASSVVSKTIADFGQAKQLSCSITETPPSALTVQHSTAQYSTIQCIWQWDQGAYGSSLIVDPQRTYRIQQKRSLLLLQDTSRETRPPASSCDHGTLSLASAGKSVSLGSVFMASVLHTAPCSLHRMHEPGGIGTPS